MKTNQINTWSGGFGKEYTDRNDASFQEMENLYLADFGLTRTEINNEFLSDMDRNIRILEVGTNIGNQLLCLQKMGFKNLYGIELQDYAIEIANKNTSKLNIIQGSAFDIPFKDNFFDLVYTSRVLIHISPEHIGKALKEIHRCTKQYIWGFEYYADSCIEINYRENKDLLWKNNFAKLYMNSLPNVSLIKEKHYKYLDSDNVDTGFLLQADK